jgi:hypothetical protein
LAHTYAITSFIRIEPGIHKASPRLAPCPVFLRRPEGEDTRFALEARESVRIGGECAWQELDRDVAFQLGVTGAVDFAHAAGANEREKLIGPDAAVVVLLLAWM